MAINSPRHILILSGRKHGSPALFLDGIDQGLAVVTLVSDPKLERISFDQLLGTHYVCILTRSLDQPDGQPKPVHCTKDLGPKTAEIPESFRKMR